MLKLFEVEGFKNFSGKISLDFSDVRDYRFNTDCISNGLVSKCIIYGKNATGKSNFGLALFDIVSHLSSKHITPYLYDYYLNADMDKSYAEFHYVFTFDSGEIDYYYRKTDSQNLIYEKISIDSELLYEYDYNSKTGNTDGLKKLAPTLNWIYKDADCILRYVINNTVLNDDHPLRRLIEYVDSMLWFRYLDENRYIGYKTKSNDYYDFIYDEPTLREFEQLLNESGVNERLTVKRDNDGKNRLYFDTKTPLPFFGTASSGTKVLYTFYYWYKTAADVSLLFMDEFDAFYHFELAEKIVEIVEKMTDTQVILTSHNTNLLSNRILRPDCYFILTKERLTAFSNATDRELREGHNLEKLYMSGEFDEYGKK